MSTTTVLPPQTNEAEETTRVCIADFIQVPHDEEGQAPKESPLWENAIASVDNSGSTGGALSNTRRFSREGNSILWLSKQVVSRILGQEDPWVIAWNSSASRLPLHALSDTGGTNPAAMFPLFQGEQACLVTTDGDFHGVERVIPLVHQSSLQHVVAVYVGGRWGQPSSLNLPVFAPFMEVPGTFLLLHYNGESLKLLIKRDTSSHNDLPSPPEVICDSTSWDEFPDIAPERLQSLQAPRLAPRVPGLLDYMPPEGTDRPAGQLNLQALAEAVRENEELARGEELDAFVRHEMIDLMPQVQRLGLENESRVLLNAWKHQRALEVEHQVRESNEDLVSLRRQVDLLHVRLQQGDEEAKSAFAQATRDLYAREAECRKQTVVLQNELNSLHGALTRSLAESQSASTSYTLSDLSRRSAVQSNRAKRALQVTPIDDPDDGGYVVEGALQVEECDICAGEGPRALIMLAASPEQVQQNTSDFALNDMLSLGKDNTKSFPNSSLCMYCAQYLVTSQKPCPYTREPIAGLLLCVTGEAHKNLRRINTELSKALFASHHLSLELQLLYAVMDHLEERFGPAVVQHFRTLVFKHARANFLGTTGTSQPFLDALKAWIQTHVSSYDSFAALRNKSVSSMSILCRTALQHLESRPTGAYAKLMTQGVAKFIAARVLSYVKKTNNGKQILLTALDNELFDSRSVGVPLMNTQHLSRLEESMILSHILFPEDWLEDNLFLPLRRYCQVAQLDMDGLVSPLMFTVLLKTAIEKADPRFRIEDFLSLLLQDSAFASVWHYSKAAVPDVMPVLESKYKTPPVDQQDPHRHLHCRYSPISAVAPVISACSLCGESFVTVKELRSNSFSSERIMERRQQHFEKHYGGLQPASGTVHFNLHQTVRMVIGPSPGPELTRGMVLDVLRYLRMRCTGGIHVPHLLRSIVSVLWDYVQKKQLDPPLSEEMSRDERLGREFEHIQNTGELFGVDIATLDGLSPDQIEELLAPLSPAEEMDMILNCDVPKLSSIPKILKLQNPYIKIVTLE